MICMRIDRNPGPFVCKCRPLCDVHVGVFIDGTCRSVQASPQQSGAAPQTPLTSPAAFTDRVGPTVSQERRVVDLHGSSVAGRGAPGLPPTQGRPYMPVQPPSLPTPAVTEDVRITAKVKACAKAGEIRLHYAIVL